MTKLTKVLLWPILLIGSLLLASCEFREELYTTANEKEINEMIAILQYNNFDAQKVKKGKDGYAMNVPMSDFAASVQLLRQWSYPKLVRQELSEIFKSEGLVPTPMEEQIRFIYGVTQELNKTIRSFDGVTDAHVHIALSNIETDIVTDDKEDEFDNAASVFVQYDPDQIFLDALIPRIKLLVGNSLPFLEQQNIVVLAQPIVKFEFNLEESARPYVIAGVEIRKQDLVTVLVTFLALLVLTIFSLVRLVIEIKIALT